VERANEFSLELNYLESIQWSNGCPLVGSWCAEIGRVEEEEKPAFFPAFRSFLPNLLYHPGLAENVVLYAIGRAQWIRQKFWPNAIDLPMHSILTKRYNLKI
jgi:hypothetical protein